MSNLPWANDRTRYWLAALGLLVLAAANAPAVSGTDRVAWRGKPVRAQPDWPEGVLELVNDPLRAEGWKPWFSEWPNDVNFYTFEVTGTNDVNRLIANLAAIKCAKPRVRLYPGKEARGLGFTTVLDEGNGAAAVFSIGSQKRIDEWYQHLKEVEPGVRAFGVARYHETPKAQPPTLMLYAGNPAIDLKHLQIPPAVEVRAAISAAERAKGENAAVIKAIDDFVAGHRAGSDAPAEKQSSKQAACNTL